MVHTDLPKTTSFKISSCEFPILIRVVLYKKKHFFIMEEYFAGSETHGDPEAHILSNIYFNNLRNSENGYQVNHLLFI